MPIATESEKVEPGHYSLSHQSWADEVHSKLTVDFTIELEYEAPPATIKPGQNFELNITGNCTKSTDDMGGWVARWGVYEAGGGIGVKMTDATMEKPYVGLGDNGFVGGAAAEYEFTVPPADQLSSEFTIEAKPTAIYKYKKGATPIVEQQKPWSLPTEPAEPEEEQGQ